MTDTPMQAALRYLLQGLTPIPIEPKGKRPLNPWKVYQSRKPTVEEVETWWQVWPDANVGLVMGNGIFAIDVDGQQGAESLLLSGWRIPEDAPTSKTGKGRHYILSCGTRKIEDAVGILEGVDIRGRGYIVAPPSIHPSGEAYVWERPIEDRPPMASEQLLERLRKRPSAWVVVDNEWIVDALKPQSEGTRDATAARLAGYLLAKGVSSAATQAFLEPWAARCVPPFTDVKKVVDSISRLEPPGAIGPFPDLLKEVIAGLGKEKPVRKTGLKGLDDLLGGGCEEGELLYLGARPGLGKTTLALQISVAVAKQGWGVLILSLEMTEAAISRRMLAQESGVPAKVLRSGIPTEGQRLDLRRAEETLGRLPLIVTSSVRYSRQVRETLSSYVPGSCGFLVVDYLQLLRGPRDLKDRRIEVEEVSKELKGIALEYKIPVLALSSLSRPPRDSNELRWAPQMWDLRESGELEHDADVVLALSKIPGGLHRLAVLKHRDGETGEVYVHLSEALRFE